MGPKFRYCWWACFRDLSFFSRSVRWANCHLTQISHQLYSLGTGLSSVSFSVHPFRILVSLTIGECSPTFTKNQPINIGLLSIRPSVCLSFFMCPPTFPERCQRSHPSAFFVCDKENMNLMWYMFFSLSAKISISNIREMTNSTSSRTVLKAERTPKLFFCRLYLVC